MQYMYILLYIVYNMKYIYLTYVYLNLNLNSTKEDLLVIMEKIGVFWSTEVLFLCYYKVNI